MIRMAELRSSVADLERTYALLRSDAGNPNHADDGKFASSPGGSGHETYYEKLRRRRKRHRKRKRDRKIKEIRKDRAEMKARHKGERADRVKTEHADRKDLRSTHVDEKREHRRGEVKERKEILRDQKKERTSLTKQHAKAEATAEKGHAKHKEKIEKEQGEKASRIAKGEKHLERMDKRHAAEKADQEKRHGELAGTVAKLHSNEMNKAKAGGAGPAEIAAIEAKQATQRESSQKHPGLEKAKLAERHAAEAAKGKAFGEKLAGLKERLARQTAARHERLAKQLEPARKELKAEHKEERATQKTEHKEARKEAVEGWKQERADIKQTHQDEWKSLKEDHAEERESVLDTHKSERQEFLDQTRDELAEEHPNRVSQGYKPRNKDQGHAERSTLAGEFRRAGVDQRRFGAGRTAKASSAEAILRHCLRQRGWAGQYARGALSGRQRLRLLECIRQYARAWLRHEAEAFFTQYGRVDDVPGRSNREDGGTETTPAAGFPGNQAVPSQAGQDTAQMVLVGVERGLAGTMARHVGRFFSRAKSFVHEAILAGALAFFDPSATPIDEDDMREVDYQAQEQVRYFDRFHQEVVSAPPLEIAEPTPSPAAIAPMTAKQFVARAEQYGDATWGAAQQVNRKRMIRGGDYTMERRIHGRAVDDLCKTCRKARNAGWQPIGTLPAIGDSECGSNCHCYFQYADAQGNKATTVRKMKKWKKKP